MLYKLRAPVTIEAGDAAVFAVWDEGKIDGALADRRFPDVDVQRTYGEPPAGIAQGSPDDFRRLRIGSGVAEAETDYPGSDVFPHDVLYDQNGGVSFSKGCFVGQEVVSRMQHRGTARRRLMLLSAETHLTPGATIEAAGKQIGTVLSTADRDGIGFVRIDRLADALGRDDAISSDGVALSLSLPPWAGFSLPTSADETGERTSAAGTDPAA